MSMENMIHIAQVVIAVLFGGLALYFKSKVKLTEKVSGLIAEAEDTYKSYTKAGGMKFEWVIAHLYVYVPAWLRPLITKDVIGRIVQFVFDNVQSYAKMQLDKLTDKVVETHG